MRALSLTTVIGGLRRATVYSSTVPPAPPPSPPTVVEQIEALEARLRYFDAVESPQWTHETEERRATERQLMDLLYDRS